MNAIAPLGATPLQAMVAHTKAICGNYGFCDRSHPALRSVLLFRCL
ncbi:MAG: hypothetical protein NHB32_25055 [Fischerella sp. CENA71]|nr:hypothetical protein [Fischerella sp. CENA71]